jgi:hypothetical protein
LISVSVDLNNCVKNQFESKRALLADVFANESINLIGDYVRLTSCVGISLQYIGYRGLGMIGLDGNISSASDHRSLVFIREDTFDTSESKIKQAENLNLQSRITVKNI